MVITRKRSLARVYKHIYTYGLLTICSIQITDADKALRSSELSVDLIIIIVFLYGFNYNYSLFVDL
jgi:hypothetical protein